MANKPLPSKKHFLQNHITILNPTCAICHDAFSKIHPPAHCQATANCTHIFGHPCLLRWFASYEGNANACPLCRRPFFRKIAKPRYKNDSSTNSTFWIPVWLNDIESRAEAEFFVGDLWARLGETFRDYFSEMQVTGAWDFAPVVYHSDIERIVNDALYALDSCCEKDHVRYFIRREDWPAVVSVAETMLDTHFDNGEYDSTAEVDLDPLYGRLRDVLKWKV